MLFLPIINFIINILKFLYTPLIIPFRTKARVYVYNYFLQNRKSFLIGCKTLKGDIYYNLDDTLFIPKLNINKLLYFLYFYFVWIWLDDYNNDIICNKRLNYFKMNNKYTNQLHLHNKRCFRSSFQQPIVDNYKSDDLVWLFYLSLFYSDNNFKNYFYYNTKKKTIFNIGYKELVFINNIPMYKLNLHR